jgi:hypothetical protein
MNSLDGVRTIAQEAHASQRDKLGRDYVDAHLRPIAEAAATFGPEAGAAGWLHDVLEDTKVSADDLRERGIPEHVIDAIESVTKTPGREYDELITRACQHPLGRFVKLVDNAWNIACNPALAEVDPDKAQDLMTRKYLPARVRLLAACELEGDSAEPRRVDKVLHGHLVRLHAGR